MNADIHEVSFITYIFALIFFTSLLVTFAGSLIFFKIKKIPPARSFYLTYLGILIVLIIIMLFSDILM